MGGIKEKFLLHVCCAPCSIVAIQELKDRFDLTVFFFNPNIYPLEEYLKRKKEVVKLCEEWRVTMIDADNNQQEWWNAVRGLENCPEGGERCKKCFHLRLAKTADLASEKKFDWFDTSLTSGRNKKTSVIHEICRELEKNRGVNFFAADWKKNGRQELSVKMVNEKNIYRQDYCGCFFSWQARMSRVNRNTSSTVF